MIILCSLNIVIAAVIQNSQPIESNAAAVADQISPEDKSSNDENSDLDTAEFKRFGKRFGYAVPVAVPVAAPVYVQPIPVQPVAVPVPVHYQPVQQYQVHTPDCGCNKGGYQGGHSFGYNYNYHYNNYWCNFKCEI